VRLGRRRHGLEAGSDRRILFPFIGSTVSRRTLDATLRLARAQDATLVPAYLVVIPQHLALESPAPVRDSEAALPVMELIEQRAARAGVPVDSRIERGRSHRHALQALVQREGYDTLVLPARTRTSDGFEAADVAWALEHAPGEVLVLRPGDGLTAPRPSAGAT
jgi:nucleotide-binding universal stress UspA family protein